MHEEVSRKAVRVDEAPGLERGALKVTHKAFGVDQNRSKSMKIERKRAKTSGFQPATGRFELPAPWKDRMKPRNLWPIQSPGRRSARVVICLATSLRRPQICLKTDENQWKPAPNRLQTMRFAAEIDHF